MGVFLCTTHSLSAAFMCNVLGELLEAFRRNSVELLRVAWVVCIIYQRWSGGGGEPWPACLLPADHYWPSAARQLLSLSLSLSPSPCLSLLCSFFLSLSFSLTIHLYDALLSVFASDFSINNWVSIQVFMENRTHRVREVKWIFLLARDWGGGFSANCVRENWWLGIFSGGNWHTVGLIASNWEGASICPTAVNFIFIYYFLNKEKQH